jgi:hypothetical protein
MMVYEIPDAGGAIRAASLGSCRTRDPLMVLEGQGALRVCGAGLEFLHGAPEALQALKVVRGDRIIPDYLSPYIYDRPRPPPTGHLRRLLGEGLDVFLLEVSDDKQIWCNGVALQQNFVSRNLVQPHRGALLPWYRQISRGQIPDEEVVAAALEAVSQSGREPGPHLAEVLSQSRMERLEADAIASTITEMMRIVPGRWILIGPFLAPSRFDKVMADRKLLHAKLEEAARVTGVRYWQATDLVAEFGVERALEGGGANIYEFTAEFRPVIGSALLDLLRAEAPAERRPRAPLPGPPPPRKRGWRWALSQLPFGPPRRKLNPPEFGPNSTSGSRDALAERINARLLAFHGARVARLGIDGAGAYRYYQRAIERAELVGEGERAVLEHTIASLPPFDAYAVMRAGYGELALLLGAAGAQVIAGESEARRRSALVSAAEEFVRAGLMPAANVRIDANRLPVRRPGGSVLGIGLDVTYGDEDDEPVPAALATYDGLLLNLRTFQRVRRTTAEQDVFVAALTAVGFTRRRDFDEDGLTFLSREVPVDRGGALA